MKPITNIADLRALGARRVPRIFYDYVESGSYDEITLAANMRELAALRLRQKVLADTTGLTTKSEILGQATPMPLAIAPTGLSGMVWGDGEILSARAAAKAGIPYCLSTMSIVSIEDLRAASATPFWFQIYMMTDKSLCLDMIERAKRAACPVLMVTVDLPVRGQRHCDIKNGLTVPPRPTLRNLIDIATKPAWGLSVLRSKSRTFGNLAPYLKGRTDIVGAGAWSADQFDHHLTWRDMTWLRERWAGKFVIKGILDADDAVRAADVGADAIVVSNHGGRQLDGAPATISVLPEIVRAAGDRIEVLFDGGIRSGQDVLRALALGARGCLLGRAYIYGLAALGEAGCGIALDLIRAELEATMMMTGTTNLRDVPRSVIWREA